MTTMLPPSLLADSPPQTRLHHYLQQVSALRETLRAHPDDAKARDALRTWQAERLGRTHQDLMQSKRYGPAAHFFLTDLYEPGDSGRRDADLLKLLPTAERLLPESGLEVLAKAIELDALSEALDYQMLQTLKGQTMSAERYAKAYRDVGQRALRERQIELVGELGHVLDRLSRKPFLGTTLKLISGPAHLAGMGDLFSFVERGYQVCRHMGRAEEFLSLIDSRERAIMQALMMGDASILDGMLELRFG